MFAVQAAGCAPIVRAFEAGEETATEFPNAHTIASGTYTGNERWDAYTQIVGGIRAWLAQLPPDIAEAIAHGNAERFLAALSR